MTTAGGTNVSQPVVVVREGPQPSFVESVFFNKLLDVQLESPVEKLVERWTQSLACSNKYGVLVVGGQAGGIVIVRPDDIIAALKAAQGSNKKIINIQDVPFVKVNNPAFSSPPCCIAISQGDEFIAIDTDRGGTPVVLIFKLKHFLVNKGNIPPYCEVRASSRAGSKVCEIAWNPGENMGNMVAIDSDDGALQLATVKGENCVEVCSYKEGGIRCMCWSPKGKQLVVGKSNGNFSQLKLDLNEAKSFAGPGEGLIPAAIHWASTTQFLILFIVANTDLDLMQLDLNKGCPPTYLSYGDIFVSDKVTGFSKCFFVNIHSWNMVICPSNTINDVPLLMKGLEEASKETWTLAEIDDNRRGAFPIDNYCVGAVLYTGYNQPTVFSEVESFGPMPYLFGVSNEGVLFSAAVVNADPSSTCVVTDAPEKIRPDILFRKNVGEAKSQYQETESKVQPRNDAAAPQTPNNSIQGAVSSPLLKQQLQSTPAKITQVPTPGFSFQQQSQVSTASVIQQTLPFQQMQRPATVRAQAPIGQIKTSFSPSQPAGFQTSQPQVDSNSKESELSQLRSMLQAQSQDKPQLQMKQVTELQKVVEDRISENEKLSFTEDNEKPVAEYKILALEVKKFQNRLEAFRRNQTVLQAQVEAKLTEVIVKFEQEVFTGLEILQDFVEAVKKSTNSQTTDIHALQEKIITHFTDVEYAKSLNERNKDPNYVQLLKSQPMDSSTLHRFREIEKLFRYVTNQVREVERMDIENKRDDFHPLEGSAAIQAIYQTLSNHSRIIKRLVQNLNDMRAQVGLCKCPDLDENIEVFEPTKSLGYGYFDKKPMLKGRPSDFNYTANSSQKNNRNRAIAHDRPSLDDLTAGMTKMHLERERLRLPERKSLRISAKKLDVLTKAVTKTVEIDFSQEPQEPAWVTQNQLSEQTGQVKPKTSIQMSTTFGTITPIATNFTPPKSLTSALEAVTPPSPGVVPQSTQAVQPSPLYGEGAQAATGFGGSKLAPRVTSTTNLFGQGISPTNTISTSTIFSKPGPTMTTTFAAPLSSQPAATIPTTSAAPISSQPAPTMSTTSAASFFPQQAPTTYSTSTTSAAPIFAKPPSTTSTTSTAPILAKPAPAISTAPIFTKPPSTTTPTSAALIVSKPAPTISTTSATPNFVKPASTTSTTSAAPIIAKPAPTNSTTSAAPTFAKPAPAMSATSVAPTFTKPAPIISTTSATSFFAQSAPTTSTTSLFGQPALTTSTISTTSVFGQPSPTTSATSTTSLFGQPAPTTSTTSLFGQPANLNFSASPASLFGQPPSTTSTSSAASIFAQPAPTTSPTSTTSLFGQPATLTSPTSTTSLFGQPAALTSPTSPASLFGPPPSTTSTTSAATIFVQPTSTTSTTSIFGQPATSTSPTSPPSLFGQPALTISTNSSATSIFAQPTPTTTTTTAASIFAQPISPTSATLTTSAASIFAQPISPTSTTSATSLFAQPTSPTSTTSLFGQPATLASPTSPASLFGQPASPTSPFGGGSSIFGGGSAVSNDTPSFGALAISPQVTQPASVFGGGTQAGSVFGGPKLATRVTSTASIFGAASPTSAFGGGSSIFGGGTSAAGSTPSSGALAQTTQAAQPASVFGGGFGGAPVFGGSKPATSTTSLFGQPATLTSPFGGGSVFGGGSSVAADTPIFGALAKSTEGAQPASVFGGGSQAGSVFGGPKLATRVTSATSIFGAASPTSAFGGGGSVFGGGSTVATDTPSFGALAQSSQVAQPASVFGGGFTGTAGASVFGGSPQPTSNTSPFGQTAAPTSPFGGSASPQKTGERFGGSAFSSWR